MNFKSKKDSLIHLRRGAAALCAVLMLCAGGARADWMSEMGFTQLKAELGLNMVTGAGVTVAQVEAEDSSLNFMPNKADSDFAGKTITQISQTGSGGISSHATSVGDCLYGNSNMSPGITSIDVYEAVDFLNNQLKFKATGLANAPLLTTMTERVANFSWIGSEGTTSADTQVLRRMDYLLSQNHILATIATNSASRTKTHRPNMSSRVRQLVLPGLMSVTGIKNALGTMVNGVAHHGSTLAVLAALSGFFVNTNFCFHWQEERGCRKGVQGNCG